MFNLPMGKMTHEIITLWYRPPEILLGQEEYTTKVDSWSAGCIFAEMLLDKPLFAGDSEIGQIFKIFQIVGTPTEENWPGVSKLPDFKNTFPIWKKKDFTEIFARSKISKEGLDLLEGLLMVDPDKRISISDALEHVKFNLFLFNL